jgi:hypothetical protein
LTDVLSQINGIAIVMTRPGQTDEASRLTSRMGRPACQMSIIHTFIQSEASVFSSLMQKWFANPMNSFSSDPKSRRQRRWYAFYLKNELEARNLGLKVPGFGRKWPVASGNAGTLLKLSFLPFVHCAIMRSVDGFELGRSAIIDSL